jgi:DNA-binding helix-hairpin-helix protein with protein kinase domain
MRAFHDTLKHLMLQDPPPGADVQGAEATGMNVIGCRRLFATVYHPGKKPDDLEWWVEMLSESARNCRYLAKPRGVIRTTPKGEAIGVLWEKAKGKQLAENFPKRKWSAVSYAKKVLLGLRDLREYGLILVDVHTKNLFRNRWNNPTFIDLLSFSTLQEVGWADGRIAKRESPIVNMDYIAPELLVSGVAPVHTPKTLDHTAFTIAYVAMKHDFPFDTLNQFGVKLSDAELRKFDQYGRFTDPAKSLARFTAPDNGVPWAKICPEVQWLFNQAFIRGRIVPDARPSLDELIDALRRWERTRLKKAVSLAGVAASPLLFAAGMVAGCSKEPKPSPVAPLPLVSPAVPATPAPQQPQSQDIPHPTRPPLWSNR